jgi:hypothetical protein
MLTQLWLRELGVDEIYLHLGFDESPQLFGVLSLAFGDVLG